jgi:hypothetical protein
METLTPAQIASFTRRFQFKGGLLKSFAVRRYKGVMQARLKLRVHQHQTQPGQHGHSPEPVRLLIALDDVTEYRFQRRPFVARETLGTVRLGLFDGAFYLNLDAWDDELNPQLIDFRNSEAFIAGLRFSWSLLTKKKED